MTPKFGIGSHANRYCYDVFGVLKNKEYLKKLEAESEKDVQGAGAAVSPRPC